MENLENSYKKLDLAEQVWVYGNSYESTLVAVVVAMTCMMMATSMVKSSRLVHAYFNQLKNKRTLV